MSLAIITPLANTHPLFYHGVARTPTTEKVCMHAKKTKGTYFSTGPTTSGRHRNKKFSLYI